MKKIVTVDGGPRKDMNTAQLLQRFAEGAQSVGEDVEVKSVRLYNLDYKGCMSCMACQRKKYIQPRLLRILQRNYYLCDPLSKNLQL